LGKGRTVGGQAKKKKKKMLRKKRGVGRRSIIFSLAVRKKRNRKTSARTKKGKNHLVTGKKAAPERGRLSIFCRGERGAE